MLFYSQIEVKGDEEVDEDGEIDIMGYKFGNVPTYMILRVSSALPPYGTSSWTRAYCIGRYNRRSIRWYPWSHIREGPRKASTWACLRPAFENRPTACSGFIEFGCSTERCREARDGGGTKGANACFDEPEQDRVIHERQPEETLLPILKRSEEHTSELQSP